jgi:hypothetical protein
MLRAGSLLDQVRTIHAGGKEKAQSASRQLPLGTWFADNSGQSGHKTSRIAAGTTSNRTLSKRSGSTSSGLQLKTKFSLMIPRLEAIIANVQI